MANLLLSKGGVAKDCTEGREAVMADLIITKDDVAKGCTDSSEAD